MEKFYHPSGTSGNGKQYQLFFKHHEKSNVLS